MLTHTAPPKIRPLNNYALVTIPNVDRTAGGLLLPDNADVAYYKACVVLALGPGVHDEPVPEGLKVGDRVIMVPGPYVKLHADMWLVPYGCMVGVEE